MNHQHVAHQIEAENRNELMALALRLGFNAFLPVYYDDGIDFILHRRSDDQVLKVQLKSRWTIDAKYLGRDIWVAFPAKSDWYLAPHDEMVRLAPEKSLLSHSWLENRLYHSASPSRETLTRLARYRLTGQGWMDDALPGSSKARVDDAPARKEGFEALRRWRSGQGGAQAPLTVDDILAMRDDGRH